MCHQNHLLPLNDAVCVPQQHTLPPVEPRPERKGPVTCTQLPSVPEEEEDSDQEENSMNWLLLLKLFEVGPPMLDTSTAGVLRPETPEFPPHVQKHDIIGNP